MKAEYEVARGDLLRMLYRNYPDAVADNVVKVTFAWITPTILDGHAAYLVESGYATKELIDRKKFSFSSATYILRMTPKGIQLIEGNIDPDPGIHIASN